jgi:hypothetical protein
MWFLKSWVVIITLAPPPTNRRHRRPEVLACLIRLETETRLP